MNHSTTLVERIADWHAHVTVDRSRRVIQNVALTGPQSRNGYSYSLEALRNAVPLYENKPVFLDHPRDAARPKDRSTRDLAGTVVNVRYESERIRGDIRVLDTDSGRTLLALAEADAPGIGMSHVVLAERSADGKLVERIHDVISVDAVINPATTSTFGEARRASTPPRSTTAPLADEEVALLRCEISALCSQRHMLDEKLTLLAEQLRELRDYWHVQSLLDGASLPPQTVTAELRTQLRQLPDDQARRRLIHAYAAAYRERALLSPRSAERAPHRTPSVPDEQFVAAIRRRP